MINYLLQCYHSLNVIDKALPGPIKCLSAFHFVHNCINVYKGGRILTQLKISFFEAEALFLECDLRLTKCVY